MTFKLNVVYFFAGQGHPDRTKKIVMKTARKAKIASPKVTSLKPRVAGLTQRAEELDKFTSSAWSAEVYKMSPKEAQLNFDNLGAKIKTLEILSGVGHNDMMMASGHAYFNILKHFFDSLG